MIEGFNDEKELKDVFKNILGVEVTLKDNMAVTERALFVTLVNKLEKGINIEGKLPKSTTTKKFKSMMTEYWDVIMDLITLNYGESASALVGWYLLEKGNFIESGDDKVDLPINNPFELWDAILDTKRGEDDIYSDDEEDED